MRNAKCLLCIVSCAPHLFSAQDSRLPDMIVDAVVSAAGTVYILKTQSLLTRNAAGESAEAVLDLNKSVPDPVFRKVIYEAITVDSSDQLAVLWSGLRQGGSVETYVTFMESRRSTRLDFAFGKAWSLSIPASGDIFAFGRPRQKPSLLAHQFNPGGRCVRSFHSTGSDSQDALNLYRTLARSRILATGRSVYILSPFLTSDVFEYQDGIEVGTHVFEGGPSGTSRMVVSMFMANGSPLAHVVVKKPTGGVSRHEIVRIADGGLYESLAVDRVDGIVFGITSEGQLATRNIGLGLARDTISFR